MTEWAEAFLTLTRDARRVPAGSVGLGTYSVLSTGVVGAELEHDERMVHLSAFPEEDEHRDGSGPNRRRGRILRQTGPRRRPGGGSP